MSSESTRRRRRRSRPSTTAAPKTPLASTREPKPFPFVALTLQTTGIHPSTAKIVAIDAVTFNAEGAIGEEFHAVINPGGDERMWGPVHLHGLSREEITAGQRFSQVLRPLGALLDGRTLVVHNLPRMWGFIHTEARRAMAAAARNNRNKGQQRGRRRWRVGRIPRPTMIVDTLATCRRRALPLADTRLRAVAGEDARATVARAQLAEAVTSREETLLLKDLYLRLVADEHAPVSSYTPKELRGDRFGLQRSIVRVDAIEAPVEFTNPGVYNPAEGLVQGMEFVIAPEITLDPDMIIAAGVAGGLHYSEKVTRQSSVIVCNTVGELTGKAMHGVRKGIPLVRDEDFLAATQQVHPGTPAV